MGRNDRLRVVGNVGLLLGCLGDQLKEISVGGQVRKLLNICRWLDLEIG